MRGKKLDERRSQAVKRITAAQIELALALEEWRSITPEDQEAKALLRAHSPTRPHVDRNTFSIKWCGKTCYLGYSFPFKIFERLARQPNCFVSYSDLLQDVWQGASRSDETIRSQIRMLKSKLTAAGMHALAAAIRGDRRHYALRLQDLR